METWKRGLEVNCWDNFSSYIFYLYIFPQQTLKGSVSHILFMTLIMFVSWIIENKISFYMHFLNLLFIDFSVKYKIYNVWLWNPMHNFLIMSFRTSNTAVTETKNCRLCLHLLFFLALVVRKMLKKSEKNQKHWNLKQVWLITWKKNVTQNLMQCVIDSL